MINEHHIPDASTSQPNGELDRLTQTEFVAAWEALVGEPPAAMLDSRSEMIRLLVESTPFAETMIAEREGASPSPACDRLTSSNVSDPCLAVAQVN